MTWFIRSGMLYWSQERGDWGSIESATAYLTNDGELPLAFAPYFEEQQHVVAEAA